MTPATEQDRVAGRREPNTFARTYWDAARLTVRREQMPEAKLTIQIPENTWIGDVSREFPEARFRILAGIPGEGSGVALVELEATDLDAVFEAMRAAETLVSLDVMRTHDHRALAQVETTIPVLLLASSQSGLPPEMPFDIVGGEATWTLTAPRERLSDLGAQFERFGVPYEIEYIRASSEASTLLTERQAEALLFAVDEGYYDTPRRCTLTELAEAHGTAKSTMSEVLHRAEEKVVKRYVQRELDEGVA